MKGGFRGLKGGGGKRGEGESCFMNAIQPEETSLPTAPFL